MPTYFILDVEDSENLRYDLEPYKKIAALLEDKEGIIRVDQHLVVKVPTPDADFIRFILENVLGYFVADSAEEIPYGPTLS